MLRRWADGRNIVPTRFFSSGNAKQMKQAKAKKN